MTSSNERFIRDLKDLSRRDEQLAGAKATNLGELARAGFLVPDGFVLTAETFERFLFANHLSANSSPEVVISATLPDDIEHVVLKAFSKMGGLPLAVRSSGIAEDLPDASFAGQYESVLNVRDMEALVNAVKRCWASAFSRRVAAYRRFLGKQGVVKMAILVQYLVPADAAGVAFTANPVTGDRTETVVNAVRGLGDRLVSGQASPDEWLVRQDKVVCQSAPEGAITHAQAQAIANLARRIERYFGSPQDIEWALSSGRLFILQARPITALPTRRSPLFN